MTTSFSDLLRRLDAAEVKFIVIGGVAALLHGSPRTTQDLDVVYGREKQNLEMLVKALLPLGPYLRGAPPGLPFRFDVPTLKGGLNFTLTTALGSIILLGEVTGGGFYEDLLPHSVEMEAYGIRCKVLDVETLMRTKRAAGRPKDFESIAELEVIRERQQKTAAK